MKDVRTLAIRVVPLPGESIDSWLEALARRSRMSLHALLAAMGLPKMEFTHHLMVDLSDESLRNVESRLKLRRGYLDETVAPVGLFTRRAPRCRYCSECMEANQGRWMQR